ncbi:MAG: MEDS domain-containing protein [Candidatus Sulfotelmatobacter sp.]
MKRAAAPIPFAGSQLDETRHVCAFFTSDHEEYPVSLPFIRDGLLCGHKAIRVVNPHQSADHLQRLVDVGIDAGDAKLSGQLELRLNTNVYLLDGRFDADP